LQLLGYSRPTPQPNKPALKSPGSEGGERNKKLTFVDDVKSESSENSSTTVSLGQQNQTNPVHGQNNIQSATQGSGPGSASRQLVPGLLYIDDKGGKQAYKQPTTNGILTNGKPASAALSGNTQAATIAKELLNAGTSPTADALAKKTKTQHPVNVPTLPTSGQGVSPKEQLAYLSQVLGFTVTYTDFPKKGEYLSLVSLSTNPPQVSHGAGPTLEASHNNAAHTALRALANTGLDNVAQDKGSMKPASLK